PFSNAVFGQSGNPAWALWIECKAKHRTDDKTCPFERRRVVVSNEPLERAERHGNRAQIHHRRLGSDLFQPAAVLKAEHHVFVVEFVEPDAVAACPDRLPPDTEYLLTRHTEGHAVDRGERLQHERRAGRHRRRATGSPAAWQPFFDGSG